MPNNRKGYSTNHRNNIRMAKQNFKHLTKMMSNGFWNVFAYLNMNYVAVATISFVVMLSFLVPDIPSRFHVAHELSNMKKVVVAFSNEVSRAEAAAKSAADDICTLHCSVSHNFLDKTKCHANGVKPIPATLSEPIAANTVRDYFRNVFNDNQSNITHKEMTIMSYLYTDSFDKD